MSGPTPHQHRALLWIGLLFGVAPVTIAPIGLGMIAILLAGGGSGTSAAGCDNPARLRNTQEMAAAGRPAGTWRHALASTFWDTGHSGYGDTGAPASGLPMQKFTAASRTLPLRSWVTVKAGDRGRAAALQIIDRGPAAWTGRDFDLDTYSAAWLYGREARWSATNPGRDVSPGVFIIEWKTGRDTTGAQPTSQNRGAQPANCQQVAARSDTSAPNERAARIIAYARAQLGKPYVWGAEGPAAFDCSGLTSQAYRAAGITIPRVAADQQHASVKVPRGQEQPGDLVFFAGSLGSRSNAGHVGLVIDPPRHRMIEAACTSCGPIRIAPYTRGDIIGFGRFRK